MKKYLLLATLLLSNTAFAALTPAQQEVEKQWEPILMEMYDKSRECETEDCTAYYKAVATMKLTKLGISRENARAIAYNNTAVYYEELIRLAGDL